MNKLMGFYELKEMCLPSVNWNKYTGNEILDNNYLWTIRSAVFSGNDLNLPRLVGVSAEEAIVFANELLRRLGDNGIVVYYPFFVAEKSGNLNIFRDRIVIEAVREDLWNLVTYSKRDITIIIDPEKVYYDGNESFLSTAELLRLQKHIPEIKQVFREQLYEGKSVMLEWSFAYNSDIEKKKTGDKYLVFYEARTV